MLSFVLFKYLGLHLLGHVVNVCETLLTVFQGGWNIFILTSNTGGFPFSVSLPKLDIVHLFNCSRFSAYVIVSHCGLKLHFSGVSDVEYYFVCLFDHSYNFFCEMSVQIICPIFKLGYLSPFY